MSISRGSVSFVRRGEEAPFSMPDYADYHGAWKSKSAGYGTKRVFKNHTTKNDYEDSLIFDMRLFSRVLIHIKEIGGVNALKYNVLACIDPSQWKTLVSDQVCSEDAVERLTDAWNWVKIQVASNVPDSPAKVNAFIEGKTP